MSTQTPEKHDFQAEVQQLLDIVVHSLYSEREIFLRELVSNASDAMEKMRLLQAKEKEVSDPELELQIEITLDEDARTITIADHGIGMTQSEMVENLGTIAHSGTKAFLNALKEQGEKAAGMIGQFGVGFYSAFMVASEVRVYSRSWRPDAKPMVWVSEGTGGYRIEDADGEKRGCRVVVQLKDEHAEFAKEHRVRQLIETYSNFVGFPILLNGKRINEVEPLWLKNKNEISEEQYTAFYKFVGKAMDEPTYRLHFAADAPLAINALVFVPGENMERHGFGQVEPGVALYCRKVLIDPHPKGLLPEWMRFLKGVVDCEDLPLNISRETMQDNALVTKLGGVIAKRVIKMLDKEATSDQAKYATFYRKFQRFLKEGVASDFTNREMLVKLLRFESSMSEPGELTSLADYVQRAKEDQKGIYYLMGGSREQIESSPYLEAFKARGIEVLYLTEAIDEYVAESIGEFEGKKLISGARGGVELEGEVPTSGKALGAEESEKLCAFLKEVLGDRVTKVTASSRLVDSPVMALTPEDAMSPQMRRMMQAMSEDFKDEVKVELEINPRHGLIKGLAGAVEKKRDLAETVARQLLDNALMAAGLLEDARDTVSRMYALMEKAIK